MRKYRTEEGSERDEDEHKPPRDSRENDETSERAHVDEPFYGGTVPWMSGGPGEQTAEQCFLGKTKETAVSGAQ